MRQLQSNQRQVINFLYQKEWSLSCVFLDCSNRYKKKSIWGNWCQFEDQHFFEMQLWENFHISSIVKCLKVTLNITFTRARILRGSCHTHVIPCLHWELWLWCYLNCFWFCGATKAKVPRWWCSLCKTDYSCWKKLCLVLKKKTAML